MSIIRSIHHSAPPPIPGVGRAVIAMPTPAALDAVAAWHVTHAIRHDRRSTSPDAITAETMVRGMTNVIDAALQH